MLYLDINTTLAYARMKLHPETAEPLRRHSKISRQSLVSRIQNQGVKVPLLPLPVRWLRVARQVSTGSDFGTHR